MSATRSLNTTRKKKPPQAFYELPSTQTSARIIEDARKSVRALPTERPYTPADTGRILFGGEGSQSRPPSVYSIHARQFSAASRPSTSQKLAPIEKTAANDIIKKTSKKNNKQTPPTPVQSFIDLTTPTSSTEQASAQAPSHHQSPERQLESSSRTSLSSEASGDLELKQSKTSPTHSKRSSSAGKRVLSGGLSHQKEANRVSSAGEIRFSPTRNGSAEYQGKPLGKKRKSDKSSAASQLSTMSMNAVDSVQSSTAESKQGQSNGRKSRKSSTVDLPFWESEIAPLLSSLESTPYSETAKLCQVCDSLWSRLEQHNLLGRTGGAGGTKRRAAVLRTVFKLLDHKDPSLLLKVAKIITAMKVTSKNLLNVCKLLFALAKDEKNDARFKEEAISTSLVDLLLSADPLVDCETMVYGLGTVKLLASNGEVREQLISAGVMGLMANTLLKSTEQSSQDEPGLKSRVRNILIQLTGALRNLSDAPSLRGEFISSGILPRLASVFSDHMTCSDIVFNISRLLSKLTLQSECKMAVLQSPSYLPLLLSSLTRHSDHADIVVRVCFILGNLTSDDADARHLLFSRHSALPALNNIFDKYLALEREQDNSLPNGAAESNDKSDKKIPSKSEDVLIKLVRLVANLSIHPEVGPAVARDGDTVDYLLQILGHMSLSAHPQLVINTLVTLNNLTYYTSCEADSSVSLRQEELAQLLVNVIVEDNHEGLLECTRVYGNLSRHACVRAVLARNKVDEMMVALLDSSQREVVYCACGVLVNLMADPAHRDVLATNSGIRKLVEVLHDFGHSDWQLASLVCKTLWNFSEQMTSPHLRFGEEETEHLIQILQTYSDESCTHNLQPDIPENNKLYLKKLWQAEFLPVAQALLSRIKSHYSDLVPLEPPTHIPSL